MSTRGSTAAGSLLLGALAVLPHALGAQESLAARISAVGDGRAQFEFPAREEACGDGATFVRVGDDMTIGEGGPSMRSRPCLPGPVRVVVDQTSGKVTSVHYYVGPVATASGVRELGVVTAAEGSAYLLQLAESGESRVAERAVMPAMLGRDVVAWPALLRMARAGGRSRHHDAVFWLGRYAAAKLIGSDDPFAADARRGADEDELKESAVFALSQLGDGDGVEPLMQVARTNRSAAVRAKALFWLGESGDPRAIDLFEQILTGRVALPDG